MKSKKIYEFKNYHNTTVATKLAKITPTKTTHTITPAKYLNNTSVMMENTKKQKNYPRQFCWTQKFTNAHIPTKCNATHIEHFFPTCIQIFCNFLDEKCSLEMKVDNENNCKKTIMSNAQKMPKNN